MQSSANATYDELSAEYDHIINEPITFAPPRDPTIFDISGYAHYEEKIPENKARVLLAEKDYKEVTAEQIENFGKTILQFLHDDWSALLKDVTNSI